MENKPNFKTEKMPVTKVITKDYRNVPQKRPKKTNPILASHSRGLINRGIFNN
jgi:hypothetical protein